MKQIWTAEELDAYWSISFDELELLRIKPDTSKIAFILQLKFYKYFGVFPDQDHLFAPIVLEYISDQLDLDSEILLSYDWDGRTSKRHRQEILDFLGFRRNTRQDKEKLNEWLRSEVFPHGEMSNTCYDPTNHSI